MIVPVKAVEAPRAPTLLRDENAAWRELAALWKLPLPEGQGDACAALAREQVHCFSKNLSLPVIRQLGRPGIVTLDSATGQPSYAVLVALTDQTATLARGRHRADRDARGARAALGRRLRHALARPRGLPRRSARRPGRPGGGLGRTAAGGRKGDAAPKPAKLDPALRNEVRAFQVAQGLPADGRPGPLTYMQLNRAAGVDEPRLRTQP